MRTDTGSSIKLTLHQKIDLADILPLEYPQQLLLSFVKQY